MPEQVPQQPVPQQQQQVNRLTGLSVQDLVAHFGRPALDVREGNSIKLQFRGRYCVLDTYLYPRQNGVYRVTYVDTRTPAGADIDQTTCISALEYSS